jgi:hypothetical protein
MNKCDIGVTLIMYYVNASNETLSFYDKIIKDNKEKTQATECRTKDFSQGGEQ